VLDASLAGRPSEPALAEPAPPGKPALVKAVKAVALMLTLGLLAMLAIRLADWGTESPASAVAAVVGVVAGYALADLVSGAIHWLCDTFFAEDTPLIGRSIIRPFRDHHRHPEAILRYSLLEQDGTNYMILVLPLWLAARIETSPSPASLLGLSALWGFAIGSLGTNLFHKWAHAPEPPRAVRWLQRRRLVLSPEAHSVHHRSYTGGYCVTNGWLNPLLDRLEAYGRAERALRRLLRRAPGVRRMGS
jgi:ubiquitin-conjugating enzyme E2 variant